MAVLTVSTFTVTRSSIQRFSDQVYYDVKVRLTETGGQSGARLQAVTLSRPGLTDHGCPPSARIGPGETWDMDSMSYCAPEVIIHGLPGTEVSASISITLTVTFADDNGVFDSLTATTDTK